MEEKINTLEKYLEKTVAIIPEDHKARESYVKALDAIKLAKQHTADNEEKITFLYNMATYHVNQATFLLFRLGLLTEELEAEFRSFEPAEKTVEYVAEFESKHDEEKKNITDQQKEFMDRQNGMDIFKSLCMGKSLEEADQMLAEYNEKIAQAQRQQA